MRVDLKQKPNGHPKMQRLLRESNEPPNDCEVLRRDRTGVSASLALVPLSLPENLLPVAEEFRRNLVAAVKSNSLSQCSELATLHLGPAAMRFELIAQ